MHICIWTFEPKWLIIHYMSASQQCQVRRHPRWGGCLPLWALAVHRTSHARLMDIAKKLKHCYVMWITRISITIFYLCLSYRPVLLKIFVPYNLKHWLYSYLYSRYNKNLFIILISVHSLPTEELLILIVINKLSINSN